MKKYSREELQDNLKFLELLSHSFPNIISAVAEVINLKAILNLPKGTEHFLSDLHGEAGAFNHVLQNASGTIKRKVSESLGDVLSNDELEELTTLIYYPKEKLKIIKELKNEEELDEWYKLVIYRLVKVCREASTKYTRSKIRKQLPKEFAYIMEELLQEDEYRPNKRDYYNQIIQSIIEYDISDIFIEKIATAIKSLTIDHLHIIGDIFDRGDSPHVIMDMLMKQRSVDIQWGNHDILWMGAAAGDRACIANVVRIALRYLNNEVLQNAYGINLLPLAVFANKYYSDDPCTQFLPKKSKTSLISDFDYRLLTQMHKAISIIQFKIEEQIIKSRPDYHMEHRLILNTYNKEDNTVEVEGKIYELNDDNFPTIDSMYPIKLTKEEEEVMDQLVYGFTHSEKLQRHIRFLYLKGSMYLVYNDNLLFHGCLQLNEDGSFKDLDINGEKYHGKALMDKFDQMAREAYFGGTDSSVTSNFLWYLWCNKDSPLFGKLKMATFERYFIDDKSTHVEVYTPFYKLMNKNDVNVVNNILTEFGVDPDDGYMINGHTPIKVGKGESPIKGGGKQLVIDGGFSSAYHKTTGIAGYTLTYNSYGLVLISHNPFENIEEVVRYGFDIKSTKQVIEKKITRKTVKDTDIGVELQQKINNLEMLISAYRKGIIIQKK